MCVLTVLKEKYIYPTKYFSVFKCNLGYYFKDKGKF